MFDKKVVFIMGSGHCGSTLLELILGSHSNIFGLGELQRLPQVVDEPYQDFPKLCQICVDECEFWNRRVSFPVLKRYFSRKHIYSFIARHISHYHKSIYHYLFRWSGHDILIDSSKQVKWIKHQLRPSYHWREITPILLYITRDGRAVVNSLLRKYPDRDIAKVTMRWKRSVEDMNKFYENFPSDERLIVSYEKLATQPSQIISNLCEFLRIKYEPAMLQYWIHDHHTTLGNLGTRSLIFRYRAYDDLKIGQETVPKNSFEQLREMHGNYYEKLGMTIKLDLRWKEELSKEQLQVFEAIAGEANRPFAY